MHKTALKTSGEKEVLLTIGQVTDPLQTASKCQPAEIKKPAFPPTSTANDIRMLDNKVLPLGIVFNDNNSQGTRKTQSLQKKTHNLNNYD